MSTTARTILLTIILVSAALLGGSREGRAQGGTQPPPDVLSALLIEVRGLREAMEQMASAGPRVQLALGRCSCRNNASTRSYAGWKKSSRAWRRPGGSSRRSTIALPCSSAWPARPATQKSVAKSRARSRQREGRLNAQRPRSSASKLRKPRCRRIFLPSRRAGATSINAWRNWSVRSDDDADVQRGRGSRNSSRRNADAADYLCSWDADAADLLAFTGRGCRGSLSLRRGRRVKGGKG